MQERNKFFCKKRGLDIYNVYEVTKKREIDTLEIT